jgi:hypothetical protein
MNHIELPQNPGVLAHAAADLYAVIYPANHALWPSPPLCNPCVHNGNPIFHDHVLDSIPSAPGHGEFNPLWHVFVIRPADPSPATQMAYARRLPMKSEADVDAAIAAGVAQETDTGSYFLCSIVNARGQVAESCCGRELLLPAARSPDPLAARRGNRAGDKSRRSRTPIAAATRADPSRPCGTGSTERWRRNTEPPSAAAPPMAGRSPRGPWRG